MVITTAQPFYCGQETHKKERCECYRADGTAYGKEIGKGSEENKWARQIIYQA
ncbi:hypothetical protein AG0111_0g6071 [Alternaria gaisen]|uniref:Uncharacterized protein n=1 Tax=Alternaria gaisen TaxID=167740 RepID=A0ACB6FNR5_9PLEO|nr:hypothetical protein AG0111_0g6071 [Alternaria gaisen]